MPRQSTAAVDNGQLFLFTIVCFHKYHDKSSLEFVSFVVVNRNYYWGNRNYYDNLKVFLPLFVVVKVNSTENYHLNMWIL